MSTLTGIWFWNCVRKSLKRWQNFWETSVFWFANLSSYTSKNDSSLKRLTFLPPGTRTPINVYLLIRFTIFILFDTYGLCYGFGGRRFFRSVDWLSGASSSMAIPLGMLDQCTLSVIFTWRQPAGLVSADITLSLWGVLNFALKQF